MKQPNNTTPASNKRRKILGAAMTGGAALPVVWKAPVVETVVLPAHAETTGPGGDPTGGTTMPPETCNGTFSPGMFVCVQFRSGIIMDDNLVSSDDSKGPSDSSFGGVSFTIDLPESCCDSGSVLGSWRILSPAALAGQSDSFEGRVHQGDIGCAAEVEDDFSLDLSENQVDALVGQTAVVEVDAGECGGVCQFATTIINCSQAF
ncbi:MAG: hypothetical protein AAF402_05505 [Pseudomonadota bacterium]